MNPSSESFEEVADWCERYLEAKYGRDVAMSFAAAIRAMGRIANDDSDPTRLLEMSARCEKALRFVASNFVLKPIWPYDQQPRMPELPSMMSVNMTYDPGPPKRIDPK